MEASNPCKICCCKESKYVCPRCNIPYCSLACYQSQVHAQCSESFYKDCVVEQIQNEEPNPHSQKQMLEILQRVQHIDDEFDDKEETDSDDESEAEELANRLAGIDLDDSDKVWAQLTGEERRQFEELIRSGDVSDVVPQWQPWWCYRENVKLVEDLDGDSVPEEGLDFLATCPPIKQNIQSFSKLSKTTPSPCVRWNVVNVLAAYAVTARVYNGDHQSSALEATSTLITLSDNLASNQLFDNPEMAVTAVLVAAVKGESVVGGVDEDILKDDIQKLVQGPSVSKQNQHVLAALSDIYTLFSIAKKKTKGNKIEKNQEEFSKRFPSASYTSGSLIQVPELTKCLKKIEFYLAWTKDFF